MEVPEELSDRDRLMEFGRLLANAYDAAAAIVSMEVWVAPAEDPGRPSAHPDRTEAINVLMLYRVANVLMAVQRTTPIIRNSDGTPALGDTISSGQPQPCPPDVGRLMRVLPERRPLKGDIRRARRALALMTTGCPAKQMIH